MRSCRFSTARAGSVPDAVVPVSFAVSGAGELAGAANANPHNVDSFKRPHRYTYHGQALAILRSAKQPGTLTLTASSPGLQSATISLPVTLEANPPPSPRKQHHHKRHKRHGAPGLERHLPQSQGDPAMLLIAMMATLLRRHQHLTDDRLDPGAAAPRS